MAESVTCDPPKFTELNDLVNDLFGGRIIFATDDWFAEAENMIKSTEPVFNPDTFTDFGKEMDGWESRRRRKPGHDWCIIQMGARGVISGVDVDTAFFTGNYAPRVSIQAANLPASIKSRDGGKLGTCASDEEMTQVESIHSEKWEEILPRVTLRPGCEKTRHNYFPIKCDKPVTHLRLNLFPDGGVARLRVFGLVVVNRNDIDTTKCVDLVSMLNGGSCTGYSNAHYGHPKNIIGQGRARIMADGWETARRLDRPAILEADENGVLKVPGFEWATFKLGLPGAVQKIEIDTNHFKGNFPDSCAIYGCFMKEQGAPEDDSWRPLLTPTKMQPHNRHYFDLSDLCDLGVITHIKLTMAPDGGVSRLRLMGLPSLN